MAEKKDYKRFTTPPFVMAWPGLFVARYQNKEKTGVMKYGTKAVWDPSKFSVKEKALWEAIRAEMNAESMRVHKRPYLEAIKIENFKKALRKNNLQEEPFDPAIVGKDAIFANLTTKNKPGVIDVNKDDIGPEHGNEELVYSGAIAQATVGVFAYKHESGGKGVSLSLFNVRVLNSKTPRMDNRKSAAEDFDDDVDARWLEDAEEAVEDTEDEEDYG
jgi:hypothetical protein